MQPLYFEHFNKGVILANPESAVPEEQLNLLVPLWVTRNVTSTRVCIQTETSPTERPKPQLTQKRGGNASEHQTQLCDISISAELPEVFWLPFLKTPSVQLRKYSSENLFSNHN